MQKKTFVNRGCNFLDEMVASASPKLNITMAVQSFSVRLFLYSFSVYSPDWVG